MRKILAWAVLASALAASPAQAAMGCWDDEGMSAVKLRDLQSRLMVSTLRCAAMGHRIAHSYNAFVAANRATIQSANGVLKAHFAVGYGDQAQTEYDRFTTALANAYGADETNEELCAEMASVADEAAAAGGERARLLAIADRFTSAPVVPGGLCEITLAAVASEGLILDPNTTPGLPRPR